MANRDSELLRQAEAERRAEAKDRDIDFAHEHSGQSEREMEFEEWCYCRRLVHRGFGFFATPEGANRPRFFETQKEKAMPRTPAQNQRQEHRERKSGKYAKVNPCYVCEKSAGLLYFSHPDTDNGIGDALLVLCQPCAAACEDMPGPEAVKWAEAKRKELGLDNPKALG